MRESDVDSVLSILRESGFSELVAERQDHYSASALDCTWVAENEEDIVLGFAEGHQGITMLANSMPSTAVLGVLAVRTDARGRGVGTWLVRRFGEEYRDKCQYYLVQVSSDSPRDFFRSLGFKDREGIPSSMLARMSDF
jgi:N-acetylglutamate synthase-like GNAT family acetyltransferase